MKQLSVLLALASPPLHAKMRAEVMANPDLMLAGDANTPEQAIRQTRMYEPQIVLCDQDMLAHGEMAVIAQQTLAVSLLVLVTPEDESWLPRVPVPVAGVIPFHHRPGDLVNKLQAIMNAPGAYVEPGALLGKTDLLPAKSDLPPGKPDLLPDEEPDVKPLAYDESNLHRLGDAASLVASYVQNPLTSPLLKRVSDYLGTV
jgi:DNA-binding NarL/FixJ family response regulator